MPHSKVPMKPVLSEGLELLGLKWLPYLNFSQANEVTPYEAGDMQWKKSIHEMTKGESSLLYCNYVTGFTISIGTKAAKSPPGELIVEG